MESKDTYETPYRAYELHFKVCPIRCDKNPIQILNLCKEEENCNLFEDLCDCSLYIKEGGEKASASSGKKRAWLGGYTSRQNTNAAFRHLKHQSSTGRWAWTNRSALSTYSFELFWHASVFQITLYFLLLCMGPRNLDENLKKRVYKMPWKVARFRGVSISSGNRYLKLFTEAASVFKASNQLMKRE